MKRTNKGLYAFLAFGPLAIALLSILGIFLVAAEVDRSGSNPIAVATLFTFMGLIVVASILGVVSMIMYIVHASKSPYLSEGSRIGWIIGTVFANGIAQFIYFFLYIMKEDELEADRVSRENYNRENNIGQHGPGRNPFE